MGARDRWKGGRKKEKGKGREERLPTPFSDKNSEGNGWKIFLKVEMVRDDLIVEFCLELDFEGRKSKTRLIHSLLSTYYVPSTVQGSEDTAMKKINTIPSGGLESNGGKGSNSGEGLT